MTTHKITIKNPLTYLWQGRARPKKYYLTANIFYSGIHYILRKKIVEDVKTYLIPHLTKLPALKYPVAIYIKYTGNIKDIDNKDYFWRKMISDTLVLLKKLPDDSTEYINESHAVVEKSEFNEMEIIITEKGET